MEILATPEFSEWLDGLREKERAQVDDRLDRLRHHEHLGDWKPLGDGLRELRWVSGRRVYFAVVTAASGRQALMLLGGDKNGQEKDIARARRILARETS